MLSEALTATLIVCPIVKAVPPTGEVIVTEGGAISPTAIALKPTCIVAELLFPAAS